MITINVTHRHYHTYPELERRLGRIEEAFINISQGMEIMTSKFDELRIAVQENIDATASAVGAFQGLGNQIADNADDVATIRSLADQLHNSAGDLAAAVTANTILAPDASASTETVQTSVDQDKVDLPE